MLCSPTRDLKSVELRMRLNGRRGCLHGSTYKNGLLNGGGKNGFNEGGRSHYSCVSNGNLPMHGRNYFRFFCAKNTDFCAAHYYLRVKMPAIIDVRRQTVDALLVFIHSFANNEERSITH